MVLGGLHRVVGRVSVIVQLWSPFLRFHSQFHFKLSLFFLGYARWPSLCCNGLNFFFLLMKHMLMHVPEKNSCCHQTTGCRYVTLSVERCHNRR
jgi:hypothetical protein